MPSCVCGNIEEALLLLEEDSFKDTYLNLTDNTLKRQAVVPWAFLISLIPLLDSYPRVLVAPTGDASGGVEEDPSVYPRL